MSRDQDSNRKKHGTAFHEAGHAVLAVCLEYIMSIEIESVEISEGTYLVDLKPVLKWDGRVIPCDGRNRLEGLRLSGDQLQNKAFVVYNMAGAEAEIISGDGQTAHQDSPDDREAIKKSLDLLGSLNAIERASLEDSLRLKTQEILKRSAVWAAVQRLAYELIRHQRLDGKRAYEIIGLERPCPLGPIL